MPVYGERQTPNNERETKPSRTAFHQIGSDTYVRTSKKGMATVAVVV